MATQRGLGKGLDALFGETALDYDRAVKETESSDGVKEIELEKVYPNPNQPRKKFDEDALNELKESILLHGVITPITVNRDNDRYMIIAGERRYRASLLAGLTKIPAIVMNLPEKTVQELALIENLQREDLSPIEAAKGIKELMERYGMTQEQVAERISKSRSNVANLLRTLTLPAEVIDLIENGEISVGHAKALAGIKKREDIIKLAYLTKDKDLSVRDLEKIVAELQSPKPEKVVVEQSLELKELINKLENSLGTKVKAVGTDQKGRIVIDYFTRDDLERISSKLLNN